MVVFCADTHLCERTWASRPTLSGDSFYSFKQIINYAINAGAEGVVCAGDMFDVRKPPSLVLKFFRDEIYRLESENIPFYYIQGQHDLTTPTWAGTVSDWPVLLDDAGVISFKTGFTMSGFSWTSVDHLSEKLKALDNSDVAVLHQVWVEFMGDHVATEGRLTDVVSSSTVFTGDYHHNSILSLENVKGDKISVVSPGSTNMRKIDEPANKYFYTADIADSKIEFTRFDLDTRHMSVWYINTEAELEDTAEAIEKFVKSKQHKVLGKPIVRLVVSDNVSDAYKRFNCQFADRAHLFFKIVETATEDDFVVDDVVSSTAVKPEDFLSMYIESSSPDFKPLQRLISSANYKTELEKLRKERLQIDAN